jgi:hypothetical protein
MFQRASQAFYAFHNKFDRSNPVAIHMFPAIRIVNEI